MVVKISRGRHKGRPLLEWIFSDRILQEDDFQDEPQQQQHAILFVVVERHG